MVAYLTKPTGSEGFQEIVDFLNGSQIRYALTKSPTIYVSLIEKFWQTTTVRTVNNGEQEITATVDGKEFTITEASVRRHLQLADVDGISVFPTTEICDQLLLMGQALNQVTELPQTSEPIPNVPDEAVYEEWDGRGIGAGGSPRCQEAMGGSITQTRSERVPTPPRDSPLPRVHTLGSDKGSMTLQELTVLCITLSKKVESLEADLKQTKQVYGAAYTKLIIKGEDQPEDQLGVLSAAKVLVDEAKTNVYTYTRRRRAVSTGSGGISTASRLFSTAKESVSAASASMLVSTAEWENIRARVEDDEELSRRLQAEERNKYSEVDQAKMLIDLINQR
ncbi:hypothetical protein Tco_0353591 [Tanacetum coccineum]